MESTERTGRMGLPSGNSVKNALLSWEELPPRNQGCCLFPVTVLPRKGNGLLEDSRESPFRCAVFVNREMRRITGPRSTDRATHCCAACRPLLRLGRRLLGRGRFGCRLFL